LLPPSRHQGTISRRFHVLNVTFRPVSSERRQHTSGHTDSHKTIKPFSWKEAGLKWSKLTNLNIKNLATKLKTNLNILHLQCPCLDLVQTLLSTPLRPDFFVLTSSFRPHCPDPFVHTSLARPPRINLVVWTFLSGPLCLDLLLLICPFRYSCSASERIQDLYKSPYTDLSVRSPSFNISYFLHFSGIQKT